MKSKYLDELNWPLSQQLIECLTAIKLSAFVWIWDRIIETQKKELNITWSALSMALFRFVTAATLNFTWTTWEKRRGKSQNHRLIYAGDSTVGVGPLYQWIQSAWKCSQALTDQKTDHVPDNKFHHFLKLGGCVKKCLLEMVLGIFIFPSWFGKFFAKVLNGMCAKSVPRNGLTI